MLAADPVDQFSSWLADAAAAGLPEPNAMVLSTVSAAGRPRTRSVLLKEHSQAGFVFYTNRTSAKAQDLVANEHVSALFPWYALRRQVDLCYPQMPEFLKLKRKYDPDELFQSEWYRHYKRMYFGDK